MSKENLLLAALAGIAVWMILQRKANAAGQNIAVQPTNAFTALLGSPSSRLVSMPTSTLPGRNELGAYDLA